MRRGRLIADGTSARRWARALLALALALVVGFSGISSASHAHPAAPAAEAASSHAHMSVGEMPGHSAPCMDRNCGDEVDLLRRLRACPFGDAPDVLVRPAPRLDQVARVVPRRMDRALATAQARADRLSASGRSAWRSESEKREP
jgi:hypothetical protein